MTDDGSELAVLAPFCGSWDVEAEFPGDLGVVRGRTTFDWLFGRRFLVQRATVDHPAAPQGHMLIAADAGAYLQHYFDSRGVVRLYVMTFDGHTWTLTRTEPDFSPLHFAQRFTGTFTDGADTITGQWEKSEDGVDWELDFRLTYRRR